MRPAAVELDIGVAQRVVVRKLQILVTQYQLPSAALVRRQRVKITKGSRREGGIANRWKIGRIARRCERRKLDEAFAVVTD